VPRTVSETVPLTVPFAPRGTSHEQVATPLATRWADAERCLPPTVAVQATVPASTGPFVSFSVAARLATSFLPARAGFGATVSALTLNVSFVSTLYVNSP